MPSLLRQDSHPVARSPSDQDFSVVPTLRQTRGIDTYPGWRSFHRVPAWQYRPPAHSVQSNSVPGTGEIPRATPERSKSRPYYTGSISTYSTYLYSYEVIAGSTAGYGACFLARLNRSGAVGRTRNELVAAWKQRRPLPGP